jgi:hypothetical protein
MPIRFTLLTDLRGGICKRYWLDDSGNLQKQSAAQLYDGTASPIQVENLEAFLKFRARMKTKHALTYGTIDSAVRVPLAIEESQAVLDGKAIARTRRFFGFGAGQPGILFGDYDPADGRPLLGYEALDDILGECVPGWRGTERLWSSSSSAYIYRRADEAAGRPARELSGAKGWHCYIVVDDASRIPSIAEFIEQKIWEAKHGYIGLSKCGYKLIRNPFDTTVAQPERIDFRRAELSKELEQRNQEHLIRGAAMLKTDDIPATGISRADWRRDNKAVKAAKDAVEERSQEVKRAYMEDKIREDIENGVPMRVARMKWSTVLDSNLPRLPGNFVIRLSDERRVTVGEIIDRPDEFNGKRCYDPMDHEYNNDKRIGVISVGDGFDTIYTHAYGGVTYGLTRRTTRVVVSEGGVLHKMADESAQALANEENVYTRGGEIIVVHDNKIIPMNKEHVEDSLSRCISYQRWGDKGFYDVDPPERVASIVTKKQMRTGFRMLRGIITAPIILPSGELIQEPGFHAASGLLLVGGPFPSIPDKPTRAQVAAAYKTFWKPFEEFPFSDQNAEAAALAMMLSTAVRAGLPRAPGFVTAASSPAQGKTLIQEVGLDLSGEPDAPVTPYTNETELAKFLFSKLREGARGVLIDNVKGTIKSIALEALLTSANASERVLGVSKTETLPTCLMIFLNGNNIILGGDLWRRILTIYMEANTDSPEKRNFTIKNLRKYCRDRRLELISAALTILRAPVITERRVLASYEDWSRMILNPIGYLADEEIILDGDPLASTREAKGAAPEREALRAMLDALEECPASAFARQIGVNEKWRISGSL